MGLEPVTPRLLVDALTLSATLILKFFFRILYISCTSTARLHNINSPIALNYVSFIISFFFIHTLINNVGET